MKTTFALLALSVALFSFSHAAADERILPPAVLLKMGYKPVGHQMRRLTGSPIQAPFAIHSLAWPVQFQDDSHTVGQNYVNFQNYGDAPYYHGGCDLRTRDATPIVATVSGKIEAGYYSYSNNPDGSMQKFWKPLEGDPHSDVYFELAVVTDAGYRFEFHHVNAMTLPKSTLDAVRSAERVNAGQIIGFVYGDPFPGYEHTHYNIVDPQGVRLNPEHFSTALKDTTAPKIIRVYAIDSTGEASEVARGAHLAAASVRKFVVLTTDSHDGDAYVQTPPYVSIAFSQTASGFTWDFREFLLNSQGAWPDLREVFTLNLSTTSGYVQTEGQYGQGQFLINLPITARDHGPFEITVGDDSGNMTHFSGVLD